MSKEQSDELASALDRVRSARGQVNRALGRFRADLVVRLCISLCETYPTLDRKMQVALEDVMAEIAKALPVITRMRGETPREPEFMSDSSV